MQDHKAKGSWVPVSLRKTDQGHLFGLLKSVEEAFAMRKGEVSASVAGATFVHPAVIKRWLVKSFPSHDWLVTRQCWRTPGD